MANIFENTIGGLWHGIERGGQHINGGIQHVGRNLGNSLGSVWNDTIGSKGLFNAFDNWYSGSGGEAATKLGLAAIAGAGALGADGAATAGTGGGGGYTVLDGMPPLGDGLEGGAMDMYGSQSSPTDASNVFEPSPHGPMSPSGSSFPKPNLGSGGGNRGGSYISPRPHDYLAYLQGQPPQSPFSPPPVGQGTFWGPQQQSPMTKGMFGYGQS